MKTTKREGFFAVDRGAFRAAALGGLNSAVAHLVMARGTARDNRTSKWSVNAVENWTGMSRPKARTAVGDLVYRGIWKITRSGIHPIYEATPGLDIPGGAFTAEENAVLSAVREKGHSPNELSSAFDSLRAKSIIVEGARGSWRIDDKLLLAFTEPHQVWIPNSVVDGVESETPPLELIRQTRSVAALRLFVELYGVQFLPVYGGVPRNLLRAEFERVRVGEQGQFVVWGFRRTSPKAWPELGRLFLTGRKKEGGTRDRGWDDFVDALTLLVDLRLVQRVGILLEGEDDDAEVIHPYGFGDGEPAEMKLALAASEAARALATQGQIEWAKNQGYDRLVPVRRHIGQVCMQEIYRLRYRAHTSATAAWYAKMQETVGQYLPRYYAMGTGSSAVSASA